MSTENTFASGVYTVECIGADGVVKWSEQLPNKVVNVGIQYMAGVALNQTANLVTQISAWYLGLITGPGSGVTIAAADTMSSHTGWTEAVPYSNGTRPTCAFVAATLANPSVATNSGSAAVFNINTSATIGGAFLVSNSAKSGTGGTLFSANTFTTGDRSVVSGDTLNVTYTFSLTAT
jgi:hypothetical protein